MAPGERPGRVGELALGPAADDDCALVQAEKILGYVPEALALERSNPALLSQEVQGLGRLLQGKMRLEPCD